MVGPRRSRRGLYSGLIVALAVPLIVSCARLPGASSAETGNPATPAATAPTPTSGPTPTAPSSSRPPAAPLVAGTAARVIADRVAVRVGPQHDAATVAVLNLGDVVIVDQPWMLFDLGHVSGDGWGPIEADGMTWHHIRQVVPGPDGGLPALPDKVRALHVNGTGIDGWIATGDGGGAYVMPFPVRCPETIDLATVSAMLPGERLACFGDKTLTLEGTYGCGGCGGIGAGIFEPRWLAYPLSGVNLSVDPAIELGEPLLFFAPDGPTPPSIGKIIRVRGHLDDSRAASCRIAIDLEDGSSAPIRPITGDHAVEFCRQRFVVESFDVIGVYASPGWF